MKFHIHIEDGRYEMGNVYISKCKIGKYEQYLYACRCPPDGNLKSGKVFVLPNDDILDIILRVIYDLKRADIKRKREMEIIRVENKNITNIKPEDFS